MVRNPYKRYAYEKARALRVRGFSLNEISQALHIAKSSASIWCNDIILSQNQLNTLNQRSRVVLGQHLGAKANHEKRQREISAIRSQAKNEIESLTLDELRIAGAILYWAEGSKKHNTTISNSDPRMVQFAVAWFNKILNVRPYQLNAHLHIHYGNDEKKIKRYWSHLTKIPLKNFGKSFIKPKGTGHRTNVLPHGIIRVRVIGENTGNIRHKILAWAERIYELSQHHKPPIA